MNNLDEKRKFPRLEASLPLRYKELSGNTYLTKGTLTKNISEGGTRFVIDRFLSLASHLVLEIKLPMHSKPVKTISKIAWIRKQPTGATYEIGNQFLAMSDEDESLISKFVKKNIKSTPVA
ncbi:MAG: PilZ domain-containing protein [Candidatus Omnitrophica bacterium]|nr:PilZ domain-containing protein [Candidatus Omnitrophota bacterium]